jgi:membrane protein
LFRKIVSGVMYKVIVLKIYDIYKLADEFITRLSNHHIFLIAAGISFNIALYLIPMFLMAVYIINLIFGYEIIAETLEGVLLNLFPPTDSARELIHVIIEEVYVIGSNSKFFGWIGFIILLWLSSTLLNSLRGGLNMIFHIIAHKIFLIYRLKDILLTIILAVLILISSFAIPMSSFVLAYLQNILPGFSHTFVSEFWFRMISLITSLLFFYFLFRFVPNGKVPQFVRLTSTGLSMILIELSRNAFAWYLTSVSSYGRFYGAYAVLVSMAIWIYYFNLIILCSAEISQFIYEKRLKKMNQD